MVKTFKVSAEEATLEKALESLDAQAAYQLNITPEQVQLLCVELTIWRNKPTNTYSARGEYSRA